MKTVGIVCEYNPFHQGHRWQIAEAKRLSGADTVICAMSGNFTQRGEAAVLEKGIRTRAALEGGAELVAEIPVIYAMSGAQSFARAGIRILLSAGVDAVSCGSECCDPEKLKRVAGLLREEPAAYKVALTAGLEQGLGFAAARQSAVSKALGPDAEVLRNPNDILAVEYLIALQEYGADIPLYLVPRTAAHDTAAESAKEIRKALTEGQFPETLESPDIVQEALRDGYGMPDPDFFTTLLYANAERTLSGTVPEDGEGLLNRVLKSMAAYHPFAELLQANVTKRYPAARVRRLLMNLALGITEEERKACEWSKGPAYLRILGAGSDEVLAAVGRRSSLPLVVRSSDLEGLSEAARRTFEAEARTTDLYLLSLPGHKLFSHGYEYTRKIEKREIRKINVN